jgi:hypothetical protein
MCIYTHIYIYVESSYCRADGRKIGVRHGLIPAATCVSSDLLNVSACWVPSSTASRASPGIHTHNTLVRPVAALPNTKAPVSRLRTAPRRPIKHAHRQIAALCRTPAFALALPTVCNVGTASNYFSHRCEIATPDGWRECLASLRRFCSFSYLSACAVVACTVHASTRARARDRQHGPLAHVLLPTSWPRKAQCLEPRLARTRLQSARLPAGQPRPVDRVLHQPAPARECGLRLQLARLAVPAPAPTHSARRLEAG